MPVMGRTLVPALMIAGLSASWHVAAAQGKGCEIDESSPAQVTRAVLNIQIAQSSGKPEDAAAKLRDAVKMLTDGDVKKNPVGRAYELGCALVFLSVNPAYTGGMTTRGQAGFIDNPTAPYDLVAGIDSAFTVVETANPECAAQTAPWRQQKAWVDLINRAIEANNADKMDSAVYLAKRANQLYHSSPYGYMVLAQASQKAEKPKDAIEQFKLAISNAKDTSQADTRRQLLLSLGNYAADLADADSGAARTAYAAEAKSAFDQLSKDPGAKYADAAQTGLARMAVLSGDVNSIKGTYADKLANPSAFSYNALMGAAVIAAKANQNGDAIQLFEAARKVNPYHRDALYNLARLYLLDSAYSKALPVARQLVALDPANSDNYQLLAIGYNSLYKGYNAKVREYDAKAKALGNVANNPKSKPAAVKAAIDSASKIIAPLQKAYADSAKTFVDSTLKYNGLMTSLPAKVTFAEFTPSEAKATIGGNVTNNTDAAHSYDLKVEFLDKSGAVVATQTVSVGPVQSKRSASFKTEAAGTGIVAFRYAMPVEK
jgi:hypothetical protein